MIVGVVVSLSFGVEVMASLGKRDTTRSDRIAYVYEDDDHKQLDRTAGTVSAHWESETGDQWRQGPRRVSLDEGLAWARANASRVLVRLGTEDRMYSAGEVSVLDASHWPPAKLDLRARPYGEPAQADARDEVGWEVQVEITGEPSRRRELAARTRDALRRARIDFQETGVRGGEVRLTCSIVAADTSDALQRVHDAILLQLGEGEWLPSEFRLVSSGRTRR